jgi:serine/threonine-protein kinase ULK/ATG1
MAEQQPRHVGDWVLEREIGSGSFAKVWRATHRSTQQVAAVKEINMDKLNKKLQESLRSEVTVLRHTKHRNIVCLLDLIQVRSLGFCLALQQGGPVHALALFCAFQ